MNPENPPPPPSDPTVLAPVRPPVGDPAAAPAPSPVSAPPAPPPTSVVPPRPVTPDAAATGGPARPGRTAAERRRRRRRRRLVTMAVLVPLAVAAGFVLRGRLADADAGVELPALAELVDGSQPAWSTTVDGRVFSQATLDGDVIVASQVAGSPTASVTRLAQDGSTAWTIETGVAASPIEAVTSEIVLVKVADDGTTSVLRGLDAEDGSSRWEFRASYDRAEVHDDRVWLLSPRTVRVVDPHDEVISELTGDAVALVRDDVVVLRGAQAEVYARDDLDRRLSPIALAPGSTSVTFDGARLYATDGVAVTVHDDAGRAQAVTGVDVPDIRGIRALGADLLLVADTAGGFDVVSLDGTRARTVWRPASIAGLIEGAEQTFVLVSDGDEIEVHRAADGASVARLPAGTLRPADGYVLASGADGLTAYSLESGDVEWSLPDDGATVVTLAERAVLRTRPDLDADTTTIELFS